MQGRTGFAVRPAIAVLAFAVSTLAIASSDAAQVETCLKAPKGAAPQGSHWYYHLDRPSLRKCWYLADKSRKVAPSETRAVARQAEPEDDEEDVTPAPVAPAQAGPSPAAIAPATIVPSAAAPAASPASAPQPAAQAPTPVITTLVTRNVANRDQPTPPPTDAAQAAPAGSAQNATPPISSPAVAAQVPAAPIAQAPSEQPRPRAIAEQPPAPAAAPQMASAVSEKAPALQLVLGGIAFFGFVASGAFFLMTLLRRRNDVLNVPREADLLPYEHSPDMGADDGPVFQPLRALDPIRRRDDVDEALHRVIRRRRAAA